MRVKLDRRIDADGRVFYAGDVPETSKYPELEAKLRQLGLMPGAPAEARVTAAPRDKMQRGAIRTK